MGHAGFAKRLADDGEVDRQQDQEDDSADHQIPTDCEAAEGLDQMASRPRALAQLGLDANDIVAANAGPQVWVSITGYGRTGEGANRVAFGDDAAAAGGLVVWTDDGPLFCADAIADPLTGLTAAGACVDALRAGGRTLLDVSMAAVSADLTGPTLPTRTGLTVAAPHPRPAASRAPELGADTTHVLAELDIDS